MSVIFAGPNNKVMMAAPGRPMLARPLSGSGGGGPPDPPPVTPPDWSAVAGLIGWWDAGTASGVRGPGGAALTAFGAPVGAVADKSGAGAALTVWHHATSGTSPPVATGHLSGVMGGIGRNIVVPPQVPLNGQQLPVMDPDQGLISAAISLGASTPWTVLLVWSRPNWRQSNTGPSTLLSILGTQVLAADNSAGTNRLVLFPGAQQSVLTSSLTRRHTHAVIVCNRPGVGVDVWLDGVQTATAAPNPLGASVSAPLVFLHNGATSNGGAECWFHEAAVWNSAPSTSGIASIAAHAARWALGPRKGVQILVNGQSNSGNGLLDGAWHLMAQGVAWHLGALGYGVVGSYGSPPAATCIHGEGLYPVTAMGFGGSFLTDPGNGSDPSTWALGADGQAVATWLQSNTAPADAADIAVILWPWSEDDSARQYSEKATYTAAARRFLALERGMLSRAAPGLPMVSWSAIPFAYGNNSPGTQMQREAMASIAADATQNVTVVLPQTADSLPRAASYDSTTGNWTGGDSLHRDSVDNQRFGRLAAPLVARAVLASGGGDSVQSIPVGIPSLGGPVVTHVYRQSNTSLIVTMRHDGGNDLIVPQTQAVTGAGWAITDGGSVASPGAVVTSTACVRLNATQLQITLAQGLMNASAACRLFYPYGTTTIGRGNVVTDNLSLIAPQPGWDIVADLGSDWSLNMPVHVPMATASGLVLSDVP